VGGRGRVRITKNEQILSRVLLGSTVLAGRVGFFSRPTRENPFSVRLGDHLFQPAKIRFKKHLSDLCHVIMARVKSIPTKKLFC